MNANSVGTHSLRAFVYVFRGESERETRQKRQPPLLHAARISKFSLRAPPSAEATVWPASFLPDLSLIQAFANVNKALSACQRRMSFGRIRVQPSKLIR